MLEFTGSTPLYIQIKDRLLGDIQAGVLQPGQKIPTEFELSSAYGVSRITVRNAVLELVKTGHLVRRQGKGTYVYKPAHGENALINQSFTTVCAQSGIMPGSRIVVASIRTAGEDDIKELKLSKGSKVLYMERVRYANGSPVVLEYNFLPERFAPVIHELKDDMSLYSLLESRFKTGRLNSVKRICLSKTNAYQSGLLGVKKSTTVIYVHEIVYDIKNVPVHRTLQYILADRFEYIVKCFI